MKRAILVIVAVAAAYLLGRTIYVGLATDETKIRWLLQGEAAAFNGASMLSALDGFAEDYRDETSGIEKASLRRAVLYLFSQRRDKETGEFRYHVELPEADLSIALSQDGQSAVAEFPLRLHEGLGDARKLEWELRVTADLSYGDGWQISRSKHETVSGQRPGGR